MNVVLEKYHGPVSYTHLDVYKRQVKGVNFVDLIDAGDPVEIAKAYDAAGACLLYTSRCV